MLLLGLFSCKEAKVQPPADVIQQKEMVQVLADVHIADAVVEKRSSPEKPDTALTAAMYSEIFRIHHISRNDFYKSYHFYERHPELMNEMYPDVINELSRRQAELAK